jgi:hypothetical protein
MNCFIIRLKYFDALLNKSSRMMPQCKNTVSFWPEGLFATAVGEREGQPIVKMCATFNYV